MGIRPEILDKREELVELCRRFHVQRLEVFGSAATDRFDATRSDVDFLVEFEGTNNLFHRFFDLLAELERLFGRPVDLLMPSAIENKYLMLSINRTRTLVYAA
jgi:predicted nucleotidyltransferase